MAMIQSIPLGTPHTPAQPPQVWGNVPQRNNNFVGRVELLETLSTRLAGGTTAVLPEALHGMGGVGKSQIAIEYVYRQMADYDVVWWIPAERPGQIQKALVELADRLGLDTGQEVNVAVPAVLEALRVGRPFPNWLLVFDNAESVDEVREFFPTSGTGKILVTSRNKAWMQVGGWLEVDIFSREESVDLLRKRGPVLADDAADELAEILGDLPLAIEQAAVWLAETGMQVEEYLTLFRSNHAKAAELLQDIAPIPYELPVAAAWNVSLDRLRDSHPAALQLLQVCAFFAPEPISRDLFTGSRDIEGPAELLEALSDPVKLARAFRSINQYGLAKLNHQQNTIALHRLVQRVIVGQLEPQHAAELRHCGHQLLSKADPKQPESGRNWDKYAALLPHVLFAGLIDCDDSWARQLVLNEIDFLYQWGDHQEFLNLSKKAVEEWGRRLGHDHPQTLRAGLHHGRALRINGFFQEAYDQHVRVRDILLELEGPEDERTLEAQHYVAGDLRYLGHFGQALELDTGSLEVLRRRFGPDDPLTVAQAHLQAIDHRLTGDPASALLLDVDTHQRKSTIFGEDDVSTLGTLASVALDEMELGRYTEARDRMRRLTQRMRTEYGDDHPGTIEDVNILSVMERKAGEHARALELSTEAVSRFTSRYGLSSPSTLAAMLNHALNLRQMGDLDQSMEITIRAGHTYEKLFGSRHPNTPTAHVNMAVTRRLRGELEQARELDAAALTMLTEVLGADHPRALLCAINLASDLAALGDTQGSLELNRRTLESLGRIFGDQHPTVLACALNYSIDLRAAGDGAEAETLFANIVASYRRVLGDTHPATISATQSIRANCDIYPIPV